MNHALGCFACRPVRSLVSGLNTIYYRWLPAWTPGDWLGRFPSGEVVGLGRRLHHADRFSLLFLCTAVGREGHALGRVIGTGCAASVCSASACKEAYRFVEGAALRVG